MTQMETEFTPSSYPVPGRLTLLNGAVGNREVPALKSADVTSLDSLMAYLQAADATYYTDERLLNMTKNDMRYAHRLLESVDDVNIDVAVVADDDHHDHDDDDDDC